jgi:hypothetical protein
VQRDQAGLAELAVAHPQPVVVGVEVVAVEPDRLADAHPGDGQQADQGLVGRRAERAGQHAGGIDERGDVGLGVQVWDCPAWPASQQPWWRDLHARVEGVQVGREPAHRRQPVRPPARRGSGGRRRPAQRVVDGGHLGVVVVEVGDELGQQPLRPVELEPQRPADAQIVGQRLAKRIHGAPVGQGRASGRSASMSTFA